MALTSGIRIDSVGVSGFKSARLSSWRLSRVGLVNLRAEVIAGTNRRFGDFSDNGFLVLSRDEKGNKRDCDILAGDPLARLGDDEQLLGLKLGKSLVMLLTFPIAPFPKQASLLFRREVVLSPSGFSSKPPSNCGYSFGSW
jgi:hypothetical protein